MLESNHNIKISVTLDCTHVLHSSGIFWLINRSAYQLKDKYVMKYCNFSSDAVSIVLVSFGVNTEPQANYQRKQVSSSVRNLIHVFGTSNKYPAGEFCLLHL